MTLRDKAIHYINRTATDRSRKSLVMTFVAPVVFFSIIITFVLAFLKLGDLLRLPGIPTLLKYIIGLPFMAIGLVAMIGTGGQFLRVRGTPVPLRPPPKLVTSGLYRFVRNPMFCGLFLFIIGLGVWLRSLSLSCVFAPLLLAVVYWEIKMIEEPELEKRFGRQYVDYRKETPRFFPRFRKN